MIENIVHYFKTNSDKQPNSSPIGTCTACWGYQQYNGKIREIIEDKFAVEITNDDLELAAFMRIRDLFAQVGMPNAPYEQIKGFALANCLESITIFLVCKYFNKSL